MNVVMPRRATIREKTETKTWVSVVVLFACVAIVVRPQIIGTPITAIATWLSHEAAERIRDDMEEQGIIPTTTTTTITAVEP